jgi:hypothetical protein
MKLDSSGKWLLKDTTKRRVMESRKPRWPDVFEARGHGSSSKNLFQVLHHEKACESMAPHQICKGVGRGTHALKLTFSSTLKSDLRL